MSWKPLFELRREGLAEVLVHGAIVWADADRRLHAFGGDPEVFGRSLMKPFQVAPFASKLAKRLGAPALALGCASHNAEPEHRAVLETMRDPMLTKRLALPASRPLVSRPGGPRKPSPLLHPCSGKHLALLHACRLEGWDDAHYTSEAHPLHAAYIEGLRARLGARWRVKRVATDGCGLPTLSFRLSDIARLFASLAAEKPRNPVWKAMTAHAHLVGGTGRLDTAIIEAGRGKVLAKEGADGLLAIGLSLPGHPRGLGVVVKIAHGWAPEQTRFVASRVLAAVGVELAAPESPHGQTPFVPDELVPLALR